MDLMDDEGLKKSVISQMMGELDDETGKSLKKAPPVKGVEIAITVSPESGEEEPDGDECMNPECEDPMHDHAARDGQLSGAGEESPDYISELLKKLG